jgi:hypothetical protein
VRLAVELVLAPFAAVGLLFSLAYAWERWSWRSWQWMASYHRWDRRWSWYIAPGDLPPRRWQYVLGWIEYTVRWPIQRLKGPPA